MWNSTVSMDLLAEQNTKSKGAQTNLRTGSPKGAFRRLELFQFILRRRPQIERLLVLHRQRQQRLQWSYSQPCRKDREYKCCILSVKSLFGVWKALLQSWAMRLHWFKGNPSLCSPTRWLEGHFGGLAERIFSQVSVWAALSKLILCGL